MLAALQKKILHDPVFLVSVFLVLLTSFFIKPDVQAIDWKVIIALFNLMAVIVALEKYQVLDRVSMALVQRFTSIRYMGACLVILTGLFAMFVTNDVALLTMVPITILIARRGRFNPAWIVIYQTLAANIGSSLTPMGNPQNLFLYEFFYIKNLEFIKILLPLVGLGLLIIIVFLLRIPRKSVHYKMETMPKEENLRRQIIYLVFFGLVVLSVLRFIDYRLMFVGTLLLILFLDKGLFLKIDYLLLATFIAFFLFVGNVSHLPGITKSMSTLLMGEGRTFLGGVLASQVISNVPAAVLLANFSTDYPELLLGVNTGGMGTLIASLASLISYKIYCKEYPAKGYLLKFHIVNFAGLFFLSAVIYLCIRIL